MTDPKSQPLTKNFKYIYGPVYSWRLGMSLGIDPLSTEEKVCNFNCIYCQLGTTYDLVNERREFIPVEEIVKEVAAVPDVPIDYLTFSGRGEPTLARNLGQMIRGLRKVRSEKIAVITNSSLIHHKDVQDDLVLADFVMAKLDAHSQESLIAMNGVNDNVDFNQMLKGIMAFRKIYKGKLALQLMFTEENKRSAAKLARLARKIDPDEIQLNTPLRPCEVRFLTKEEMASVRDQFKGLPAISVYDAEQQDYHPFDETDTVKRHGRFKGI